jgi:hypothetical protein
MQSNSVYLYPNKIDAYTNPLDSLTAERYRKVYNRNLKIYRSVDNRIDLQLRNSDQKSLSISSSAVIFNIIGREDNQLLVQKEFTLILDDTTRKIKGRAYVTLTSSDLEGLEEGSYSYSILQEERENLDSTGYQVTSRTPLYVDSQYGVVGTIDVSGDALGSVINSLVVNNFSYVNPLTAGETTPKYYISSIIDAQPNLGTAQSIHSFQMYFNNYSGSISIEGSIDDQGASPSKWTTVLSPVDLTAQTNPIYKNIVGKYNWFRIKHLPSTINTGTVDKILYR